MLSRVKLNPKQFGVGYPSVRDESVLNAGGVRAESALFSFAVDGGAVGTYHLGRKLPAGAFVTQIVTDAVVTPTSGGAATIKLQSASSSHTTTLIAAAAFGGFTGSQFQTVAAPIKIPVNTATAVNDEELQVVIAVAALTAGEIRFIVRYLLPNDGHHD